MIVTQTDRAVNIPGSLPGPGGDYLGAIEHVRPEGGGKFRILIHNLDTDASFYGQVISTHKHADRIDTLGQVRQAGIKVCSGGIIGMGESRRNRAALIVQLANLEPPPESVPINNLVPIPGTPLADSEPIDSFEFVRTIAAARITMPNSFVRLSAGRQAMSDELQALCFLAGANSIFYGDRLLTTDNPQTERDDRLFARLGIRPA